MVSQQGQINDTLAETFEEITEMETEAIEGRDPDESVDTDAARVAEDDD